MDEKNIRMEQNDVMNISELANNGARDFNGKRLCIPCWNGVHYFYKRQGQSRGRLTRSEKISNCAGHPCECDCVALMAEKHPRIKKDRSGQITIMEQVGTIQV